MISFCQPPLLIALFEPLVDALGENAPLLLGGGAALVAVLVLLVSVRRLRRLRTVDYDTGLIEILADLPPAPDGGTHRVMFEGQPVRVRLAVLAPSGRAGELRPSMVEGILEGVLYGLGVAVKSEQPRVRIWPAQLSQQGFAPAFFRRMVRPEGKDAPSRWILAAGPARVGANVVLLGLVLETREPTLRGSAVMKLENWPDRLRIQT